MNDDKQTERTERARAALAAGQIKVTPQGEASWSVVNGDSTPYTVTRDTCTCKDFENSGKYGLRCKHIEAVRIIFPTSQGEKMETSTATGWVKLYHPAGTQVTLPIPLDTPITAVVAKFALDSVSALLEAGFLVEAPGLDDGEQKQEVVSVARRASKDATPIVAFYLAHPKTLKKFLHAYLNTPEEVQAFETATGLKLEAIPLWPGERDIDKDHRDAGKYIVPLPRPVNVVWATNPKWQQWSAEGGKAAGAIEPHKRILVRYDASAPKQTAPLNPAAAPVHQPTVGDLYNESPAPIVRMFGDGTHVPESAFVAFDAFQKARKAVPASVTALREWFKAAAA